MIFIAIIFLYIEVFVFLKIEKKLFGTLFTPVSILAIPFCIVVLLCEIIAPFFGYIHLAPVLLWAWIIGLFFFYTGGLLFALPFISHQSFKKVEFSLDIGHLKSRFLDIITVLFLIYMIVQLRSTLGSFSLSNLEDEEFGGNGLVGHVSIVMSVLLIIYVVSMWNVLAKFNKFKSSVLILLILMFAFIYGVKSWFFIPLITAFLILKHHGYIKLSLTKIIVFFFLSFILFSLPYMLLFGENFELADTIDRFIYYFFSGVLGFSGHIASNMPVNVDNLYVINPIVNIFNVITKAETKSVVSDMWAEIGGNGIFDATNVKTFFGTLYIYEGWFGAIITALIAGFLHYIMFIFAAIKKNLFLTIAYFYWAAMLFFGWFEIYLIHLPFYEIPIICFIFYFFSLKKITV
jgi:oligosaccharide repeat unit polymerase